MQNTVRQFERMVDDFLIVAKERQKPVRNINQRP